MASKLGWMDHDEGQRRRMLAAIELFKDEGTVDELGVGAVRDTIAGALFPGVSVLHTRARYLLFVPWCVNEAAAAGHTGDEALRELRRSEIRVLHALLQGDPDQDGLIGRVAKDKLKRLPSAGYWSVLQKWGIRRSDATISGYLRDAKVAHDVGRRAPTSDDPESGAFRTSAGFDPNLPVPPADLHTTASFTLLPAESSYLADRWRMTTKDSLLPWLLDHGTADCDQIWLHPLINDAPAAMRSLVEHGQRFSRLMHGAALLYNLLLAEKYDDKDDRNLLGHYTDRLTVWQADLRSERVTERWESEEFWMLVRRVKPGLARPTQAFVNRWIELVSEVDEIAKSDAAHRLVADRERSIKGGRARLFNPAALQQWQGASGLVQMDFNWRVARRLMNDVLAGMGA